MIDFRRLHPDDLNRITDSLDAKTYATVESMIEQIRESGESAIRQYAEKFDSLHPDDPLIIEAEQLTQSLARLDRNVVELLQRTRDRIEQFAQSQRRSVHDLETQIPGGRAGHRWFPLATAGCYAPGGRYPLPSSVLMTAVTARVAGVENVIVASPNPGDVTLAAAAIAGADKVLRIGGAQAIATLAFGLHDDIPTCDVIVGPGNRFVTAAKSIVSRFTKIDTLAGPSELVVATAGDADPSYVAADLLAQAEHDPDARPILITTCSQFPGQVMDELNLQLENLPTARIAEQALGAGGYLVASDLEQVLRLCRRIAPEHLSVQGSKFESLSNRFEMGAALFIGSQTAEVFGDYGAGPNHTLPTGGAARSQSGLSVFDFLRFQTFLELDPRQNKLTADAAALGRLEGLEAHARSAERRV